MKTLRCVALQYKKLYSRDIPKGSRPVAVSVNKNVGVGIIWVEFTDAKELEKLYIRHVDYRCAIPEGYTFLGEGLPMGTPGMVYYKIGK